MANKKTTKEAIENISKKINTTNITEATSLINKLNEALHTVSESSSLLSRGKGREILDYLDKFADKTSMSVSLLNDLGDLMSKINKSGMDDKLKRIVGAFGNFIVAINKSRRGLKDISLFISEKFGSTIYTVMNKLNNSLLGSLVAYKLLLGSLQHRISTVIEESVNKNDTLTKQFLVGMKVGFLLVFKTIGKIKLGTWGLIGG